MAATTERLEILFTAEIIPPSSFWSAWHSLGRRLITSLMAASSRSASEVGILRRFLGDEDTNRYSFAEEKDMTAVGWQLWALLSAVFASLTAILGKVGVEDVDPDLATG